MSTSALVVFNVDDGLTGTVIHHMGFQVPEQLMERFNGDVATIREFLVYGSSRGGYRTVTDEGPMYELDEDDESVLTQGRSLITAGHMADVVYLLDGDGKFAPVELELKVTAVPA